MRTMIIMLSRLRSLVFVLLLLWIAAVSTAAAADAEDVVKLEEEKEVISSRSSTTSSQNRRKLSWLRLRRSATSTTTPVVPSRTDAVLMEANRWVHHCATKYCNKKLLQLGFCMSSCSADRAADRAGGGGGNWDPATLAYCHAKCKYNTKQKFVYDCYEQCHHKCQKKKCSPIIEALAATKHHQHRTKYQLFLREACQLCSKDTDCVSNICILGLCQPHLQHDYRPCHRGLNHCESGICGLAAFNNNKKHALPATTVCCPAKTGAWDPSDNKSGETAATAIPATASAASEDDDDDVDDELDGERDDGEDEDEAVSTAFDVAVVSGESTSSSDDDEDSDDDDDDQDDDDDDEDDDSDTAAATSVVTSISVVCGGQPVGAPCFRNELCQSGKCAFADADADDDITTSVGVCACTRNKDCKATTTGGGIQGLLCVNGQCQPALQRDGDECGSDVDCGSGHCAHAALDFDLSESNSPMVCCPAVMDEEQKKSSSSKKKNGKKKKKKKDKAVFTYYFDEDKNSGEAAADDGEDNVDADSGTINEHSMRVCGGQPAGAACFTDKMCLSGTCMLDVAVAGGEEVVGRKIIGHCACEVDCDCSDVEDGEMCIAGVCTSEKQPDGAACDTDSNCANGVCGHDGAALAGSPATSDTTVCCPSGGALTGTAVMFRGDHSSKKHRSSSSSSLQLLPNKSVCTGQPIGSPCNDSILCIDGTTCVKGQCTTAADTVDTAM